MRLSDLPGSRTGLRDFLGTSRLPESPDIVCLVHDATGQVRHALRRRERLDGLVPALGLASHAPLRVVGQDSGEVR